MHVRPVEHHRLLGAQARVIQHAEHRVIPSGRGVLTGGHDPALKEIEERGHPFRQRRRIRRWGIFADMPRGVELIHRADQADPERRLDLDSRGSAETGGNP